MILAGDIGGSNTRLAVFDGPRLVAGPTIVPTADEASFLAGAHELLDQSPVRPLTACFAVAGPVLGGRAKMTNVDRTFDETLLADGLGLRSVTLINDLVANVSGIDTLALNRRVTLLPGTTTDGNRAIVSPGTGLGEAAALWLDGTHRPVPSEGGHCHFSPTTEREGRLYRFLAGRFDTVTQERVLSGPGIVNVFDFCRAEGISADPDLLARMKSAGEKEAPTLVSRAAAGGSCAASAAALRLFARLLGIEASNVALKFLATGGMYLGGGIPPKIVAFLDTSDFRDAFCTHQTMSRVLAAIPVHVILDDHAALEGAALYGTRYASR